jgi:poly(ADP-ribose) glycohydrolase
VTHQSELPNFRESKKKFRKAIIQLDGTIEDCIGTLQLDFANKFLGGGVLNSGCVQEEIRFVICPELLVSLLFTEQLKVNESVIVRGCERFSSYRGYGDSFEWSEDYQDKTTRDKFNRLYTDVLAIDALYLKYPERQFEEAKVRREIEKCFAGFRVYKSANDDDNLLSTKYPAISTGNWGCGAFRGDKQLKFIIQLMVAAETHRDLIYFTFSDEGTLENLNKIQMILERHSLNVGQVYQLINEYADEIRNIGNNNANSRKQKVQMNRFGLVQFLEVKFSE